MFNKWRLKSQLEKLTIQNGDFIVLRVSNNYKKWLLVLGSIIEKLKTKNKIEVTGILLPNDIRFGSLTEREMNNAGWFRQDAEVVEKILDDNKILLEWNESIKKLHIDDALKAHEIQVELKERLKTYEIGKE